MEQNRRQISLVRGTGLVGAVLILAGAIATALQPAPQEQQSDPAPRYFVESAALRGR